MEADEQREGEFRPVHARALIWGDKAEVRQLMEVLEMGQFDLVIGSDVIYPESVSCAGEKRQLKAVAFMYCIHVLYLCTVLDLYVDF